MDYFNQAGNYAYQGYQKAGNLAYQGYQKAGKYWNQGYHIGQYLFKEACMGNGNVFNNVQQGVMNMYNNQLDYDKMNQNEYFGNKIPEIEKSFQEFNTDKFIDRYFRADLNALINYGTRDYDFYKSNFEEDFKRGNLGWKRISDLINKEQDELNKNTFLVQSPKIVNFCYCLISFLRGMLRFQPYKYYQLFKNENCIFEKGYFEVRLYVDYPQKRKEKKKVFVDDYIPYINMDNMPYFSRLESNNVSRYLLIEKALAKFFGSYYNIYYKEPEEIIYALTGILPNITNELKKAFNLKNIKDHINKKNVIICNSGNIYNNEGIRNNHSYTIIDIIEEKNIICLDDPLGNNFGQINPCYLNIDIDKFTNNFKNIYICDFYSSSGWLWPHW